MTKIIELNQHELNLLLELNRQIEAGERAMALRRTVVAGVVLRSGMTLERYNFTLQGNTIAITNEDQLDVIAPTQPPPVNASASGMPRPKEASHHQAKKH